MKKGYHKTKDGRTAKKDFTTTWTKEKKLEQVEKVKEQYQLKL